MIEAEFEARAKINLTLEVFGVRSDGYHALRSVVLPVSLSDTLRFARADEFSSDTGYDDDLCLKAARTLANACPDGLHLPRYRISVDKRIPVGGGLGGGSADAAATLRALNRLWELGLAPQELAEIAVQVGSDVPALVLAQELNAPVLMEGRGEKVTPVAAGRPTPPLHLVLANPGVFSSTKEVFAHSAARPTATSLVAGVMIAALASGDPARIAAATVNDLEEAAVRLHPEIGEVLAALRAAGSSGAAMSGSGATVFAPAASADEARRIAEDLRARGFSAWNVTT